MPETVSARLDLLQSVGKVNAAARRATDDLLGAARTFLGQDLEDSHGLMMATHLALACQRVLDGIPVAEPPAEAAAELAGYEPERTAAARLARQVEPILQAPFPQAEVIYLAMHLAARRRGGDS